MKTKHKQFVALSLAGLGALGALASVSAETLPTTTSAGVSTKMMHVFGKNQKNTRSDAVTLAITNGDYQAFLTATKDKPASIPTITETQFNALVQAQKLRAQGDETGAKKLLDDAGIKGPGVHEMRNMPNFTDAQKATLKQARTLFEAGKQTEAQALLGAAGIKMPEGGRGGSHNNAEMKAFSNSLTDAQKAALKQSRDLMKAGKKTEADAVLKAAGIKLPAHTTNLPTSTQ